MAQATQATVPITHDVFLAFTPIEQPLAQRLSTDLQRIGLSVHPTTQSAVAVLASRVILVLQATPKLDESLRAVMALAQQPSYDRPLLTLYIHGEQIALWRVNNQPVYLPYIRGVAHVVQQIWQTLEDPRALAAIDILEEAEENALVRFLALKPATRDDNSNPSS